MKAAFSREYKKFGISSSRKPQEGYPLAGVVQVVQHGTKGFVYIKFAAELVDAVGRAMPQGVSDSHPCYLRATLLVTGRWRVTAYYLGSSKGCLLWEADSLEWVKRVRKGGSNGSHTKATEAGS